MTNSFLWGLTFASALGSGLIAGVFFAFSTFVMKGLVRLPASQAIAAMNSINVTVINPWFMGVFMGTAALCLLSAGMSIAQWQRPASPYLLAGSLLYLLGSILVTMMYNVPLNDALAAVDGTSANADTVWASYVRGWMLWNHVRTAASLLAAGSFTIAFTNTTS